MFGNLDPRKIQGMMSKLGVKQEEIQAKRVIIEQEDKKLVINNPSITRVEMSGNVSYQIAGEVKEEPLVNEEDIKLVMEKTHKSRLEAEIALKNASGDLTEAIMNLS